MKQHRRLTARQMGAFVLWLVAGVLAGAGLAVLALLAAGGAP